MKDTIRSSADRMTSGRSRWPWTVAALILGLAVGSGVVHVHPEEIAGHLDTTTGLLHAAGDVLGPLLTVLTSAGALVAWWRSRGKE